MTQTRLSRSGTSSAFGKRSEPLKTFVSVKVKDELDRRVAIGQFSSASEAAALLIEGALFGVEHIANVQRDRLFELFGKGPESGRGGRS